MAALALNPPHPKLTWVQIVEYTTIAEFELLCMGVWMTFAIWSGPIPGIVRPLSVISQLLHAQEENTHLNVEIKRLATWLIDEPLKLDSAIELCTQNDLLLAAAISNFAHECKHINRSLLLGGK